MFMRVNTLKFYPDILRRSRYWGSIVGKLINNLYYMVATVYGVRTITRDSYGELLRQKIFFYIN